MRNTTTQDRDIAGVILTQWKQKGRFPDRQLEQRAHVSPLLAELVFGTIRWYRWLDWIVEQVTTRRPPESVRPYLWLGLYQILETNRIAEYAAVNETVHAVKRAGLPYAAGFVNGVLRNALKNKACWRQRKQTLPLPLRESHPDLLVERWRAHWGETNTDALCRTNNLRPHVCLIPLVRGHRLQQWVQAVQQAGGNLLPHPAREQTFILQRGSEIAAIPGYADGAFTVQDPATLAAVDAMAIQPGMQALDACAAPGGKTLQIANRLRGSGELVACDLHADRLDRLHDNLQRAAGTPVRTCALDATCETVCSSAPDGKFDRILLDVPCSNTGVIARRPDVKWRFSLARLKELTAVQQAILTNLAPCLRRGGRLIYSTCSLEPEENSQQIQQWLASTPGWKLVQEELLFPPESQTDGAYLAVLSL